MYVGPTHYPVKCDDRAFKYDICMKVTKHICDMIKGNESLVENFNSYFLPLLSFNFKMLHFDPILITIGYLVTEL